MPVRVAAESEDTTVFTVVSRTPDACTVSCTITRGATSKTAQATVDAAPLVARAQRYRDEAPAEFAGLASYWDAMADRLRETREARAQAKAERLARAQLSTGEVSGGR